MATGELAATLELDDLALMRAEATHIPVLAPRLRARRGRKPSLDRWWLSAALAAVVWSLWGSGLGRRAVLNPGGWAMVRSFWSSAVHPDLSPTFLRSTVTATATTVEFAVVGTALSVVIGLFGGVLLSETWWRRRGVAGRAGRVAARLLGTIPGGVHEAVWALVLVNVLGRDPIVGVAALALPFGAVTAKVYADLIDDSAGPAYAALRSSGAGRTISLVYGVAPVALPAAVSYGFYRLECALRSAVILGMIGAGGLGFQLSVSFQSLDYRAMWTSLYVLMVLSAAADWCSGWLRRPGPTHLNRKILLAAIGLVALCWWRLGIDLGRLTSNRTSALFRDLLHDGWPPVLPRGGWRALLHASIATFQMSLLAITLASTLAVGMAFLAARRPESPGLRRVASLAARSLLLMTRAIPAPVWALLVLFVVLPGPLPGALALGLYNFGVLGRLMAEAVEQLDPRPGVALRALGAPSLSIFVTATAPLAAPRFSAYALYRWEVVLRETVVVGVVGAGGLGRLLEQQRVAFAYDQMASTVIALIALSYVVDRASARLRRAVH